MQVSKTDRRYTDLTGAQDNPYADATHVVRQGMQIQASLGTRSAVEFLKQHGVHGAVIHRVLMGEQVRMDDQVAIDDPRM
ncbi:hypothetical protein AB2N08_11490 [Massilia aurea]|uniref:hypothetical protein n=1 Tax=Massilia aurea TaxID=373040 RepID=UPI00346258DD